MVRESIGCRRCPTTLLTVTDYLKVLLFVTVVPRGAPWVVVVLGTPNCCSQFQAPIVLQLVRPATSLLQIKHGFFTCQSVSFGHLL